MAFAPVKKLEVWRTLSQGDAVRVGLLAQNGQGVFFQYDLDYLSQHPHLSPLGLEWTADLQQAPASPHQGLHGCFADSLPDGWGLLLQDRIFRQQGALPAEATQMDRLALVGAAGIGALGYRPATADAASAGEELHLHRLGLQAQALFEARPEAAGQAEPLPTGQLLAKLAAAGSSGGARPKASVFFRGRDFSRCRTQAAQGDDAWLVKFTSQQLPLGHEEGLCEAAYLQLAAKAGLAVPEWELLPASTESGAALWLAQRRFDCTRTPDGGLGRLHLLSACGLLDADFRSPSLDYEALIKASSWLCKSPQAGQVQFRRAVFNLFACNQDDHSKNWAFLQSDGGDWSLAPFYDVTFSPHPFGEHATAYAGFGKQPPVKAMQQLAEAAGFASWPKARQVVEEVAGALAGFAEVARPLGVQPDTLRLIERALGAARQANRHLLA